MKLITKKTNLASLSCFYDASVFYIILPFLEIFEDQIRQTVSELVIYELEKYCATKLNSK